MELKNDLILRAAWGKNTERTPVWLMRQAGRVLPEYREVRQRVGGFKEMVTRPELAAEVTLQPVDILGVDAAIIFSDILVIPEAMGLPYKVVENRGPWFERTIENGSDIDRLHVAEGGDLQYVLDAIDRTCRTLGGRVPLIGFAGAPWTILAYMIEGHGSKTFSAARKFLYTQPQLAHRLLEKITASTINYLKAQVAAGADLVQLFDSWAGILSPEQYGEFSLRYLGQICDELSAYRRPSDSQAAPVIVFAKGAFFARRQMQALNCQVIGLDWNMDIGESRTLIGEAKTLQGNMDPCLLYAPESVLREKTIAMLEEFGPQRHIANLGHGLYPDIEKEKVKVFVDTIKEYRFKV
jgi:uroporphyrinogen decarboxylase